MANLLLSVIFGWQLLFIGAPSPLVASVSSQFTGQVVGIIDGDTVDVLHNGQAERIRLNGIDCPERKQAYGKRAKQFTSGLIFGKQVTVKPVKRDRHGRTVGDVLLPGGTNVAQELVRAGFAWWYKQYAPHDETLAQLEGEAREEKRGLWAEPNPLPPWVYRHPELAKEEDVSLEKLKNLPAISIPIEAPIIGNKNSGVYHRPDCPSYKATAPRNRVVFNSEKEAKEAGYRVAGNCPP